LGTARTHNQMRNAANRSVNVLLVMSWQNSTNEKASEMLMLVRSASRRMLRYAAVPPSCPRQATDTVGYATLFRCPQSSRTKRRNPSDHVVGTTSRASGLRDRR